MKCFVSVIVSILVFQLCYAQERIAFHPSGKLHFQTSWDKIFIKFKDGTELIQKKSILDKGRQNIDIQSSDFSNNEVILTLRDKISNTDSLKSILKRFESETSILYASPFLVYQDGTPQALSNRLIIRLKKLSTQRDLENLLKQYKYQKIEENKYIEREYIVTLDKTNKLDALDIANNLFATNKFEYSEVDFVRILKPHTSDPYYNSQWAIKNTGQFGTACADMKVPEAWSITSGSSSIKVAIIDEGVDLSHPDLQANLLSGYDATGGGTNGGARGNDAHGTACAGVIAAVGNNGIGVDGVAYSSKIIPVRVGSNNSISTTSATDGFNWVVNSANADIISCSWGGGSSSSSLNTSINNAVNNGRGGKGCIVLFSAGNNNGSVSYPASLSNVIAVGASSMCDERKSPSSCDGESWWGSNYGSGLDIVAPGVKIATTDISGIAGYSSKPNWITITNDYVANFNGTSSACPNAAGVVALILSVNPNLNQSQVRAILESTTDKIGGYSYSTVAGQPNGTWNNEVGYGRVNALNAVKETFKTIYTIFGPTLVCNSAVYSIPNLPAGATVSWSVSGAIAISGSSTSSNVAVVKNYDGTGTLTANINTGCGNVSIKKDVKTGLPQIEGVTFLNGIGSEGYFCTSHMGNQFNILPQTVNVSYQYRLLSWPNLNVVYTDPTLYTSAPISVNYMPAPGWYVLEVKINNACGSTEWIGYEVEFVNCSLNVNGGGYYFSAYPNPANDYIIISQEKNNNPVNPTTLKLLKSFTYILYNDQGKKQHSGKSTGEDVNIDIRSLQKGTYFLHIKTDNNKLEKHQIIIRH